MKLSVGFRTDPGPRGGLNEDAVLAYIPEGKADKALLVVADGMGGARAGELASREAVTTIRDYLLEQGFPTPETAEERLRGALLSANRIIHEKGRSSPELEGMGSTAVVALVIGDSFWVAHVGDSRAYLVRGGSGHQLTRDHTWTNRQVRKGLLTPAQAANLNINHVLERALGPQETIEVEVGEDDYLEEGDVLVLCTDGLHGVLSDQIISWIASNHPAQEAADLLIEQALQAPTKDNVSVVVLRVEEAD